MYFVLDHEVHEKRDFLIRSWLYVSLLLTASQPLLLWLISWLRVNRRNLMFWDIVYDLQQ